MYFILSKVLLFLLSPYLWIVFLIIAAFVCKRKSLKNRFFIAAAIVFIIFSNPYLLFKFVRYWDYPRTRVTGKYSCAILLGGFAAEDGWGGGYFDSACDRFIQAVELKTTGCVSHILVSSGNASLHPDQFKEADWAKTQLLKLNIPDSALLIEDKSRNTFENASFSLIKLRSKNLKPPYILVTGAFHMRRAMLIFKKAGVQVIPYPSEYFAIRDQFAIIDLLPRLDVLTTWERYLKEIFGVLVTYFK